MKVRKAIIPAAGLGTRVLPASKAVPKEMLNIVDKPAIQYLVEEAAKSGITDVPSAVRAVYARMVDSSWETACCIFIFNTPYIRCPWAWEPEESAA